jgi:hypothetical protein
MEGVVHPLPSETGFNNTDTKRRINVKSQKNRWLYTLLVLAGIVFVAPAGQAESTSLNSTVPVRMTVTAHVDSKKRMPSIQQQDVLVKSGKQNLAVNEWVPAKGDRAGLELFILIDEAADWRLGSQLDDIRSFIKDQPESTLVGVGYMSNATVRILQDLTSDHLLAANAIRLPRGTTGSWGDPYLSVVDLMKRWPESNNRHEVVMITDGIDRRPHAHGMRRGYYLSPDMEVASSVAQKTGTNIHTIYTPGVGRLYQTFWAATNGQTSLARLSESTGGMSFYLGLHSAVSFEPYLADLQRALNNQYLLSFSAKAGKKSGLQQIRLSTQVAGVDFASHDAVWVPAAKQ